MQSIQKFLLACSGATPLFLKRSPTETNKFIGIGGTILFTGLLAGISAGFALFTIFKSYWVALSFGIVWGIMIFNLDRFIVSTIRTNQSWTKNLRQIVPRLFLAVLIAIVISTPLELKIFDSEIEGELITMEQELYKDQEAVAKSRFDEEIIQLKSEITDNEIKIKESLAHVSALEAEAIAEADGTGGSQKRNMGPIYALKKATADQAKQEHMIYADGIQADIARLQAQLTSAEEAKLTTLSEMRKVPLEGFAARLDALGRLSQKSSTIYWASIFITLLFIAIETTPIFAKVLAGRGPYDYTLSAHEYKYKERYDREVGKAKAHLAGELNLVHKTTKVQSDQLAEARNEIFIHGLQQKVEEEKQKVKSWSELFGKQKWMEI